MHLPGMPTGFLKNVLWAASRGSSSSPQRTEWTNAKHCLQITKTVMPLCGMSMDRAIQGAAAELERAGLETMNIQLSELGTAFYGAKVQLLMLLFATAQG